MIRNYFKIAWRNVMKNKVFSFINIFGLSVGLTCCMLIALYMNHEYGYDTHHKNGDRIYQLGTNFMTEGKDEKAANTAAPLGSMMQQDFPEIAAATRMLKLFRDDKTLLQVADAKGSPISFYETNGYLVDSNFFGVLTYSFKEGTSATALTEPNTVVLSEGLAHKLFGKGQALDQLVHISSSTNGDHDFKVKGVFSESSVPSHIDANFFMSFGGGDMNNFANDNPSPVNNNMFFTYLLLKEGATAATLEKKFPAFVKTHIGNQLKTMGKQRRYFLTPVKDIHLSDVVSNVTANGSKTSLFILSSIALLTLLIACINFMNLSTSGSAKRAAEVGVRKVLGAQRGSLFYRFMGESLFMAAIGLLVAFLLTAALLPFFENISGKDIHISWAGHAWLFAAFILLAAITGLLAGIYPSFYLSSFKPIKVLKGKFSNSLAAVSLRKGMVVFQFVISVVLIIASLVIANQMKYMRLKDLGFIKDQQVVIPLRSATAKASIAAFRDAAKTDPAIVSLGACMSYPGIFHPQDWSMYKQGQTMNESKRVYINMVDQQYLQTIGMQPVAGPLFSTDFPADSLSRFVVNEEAVKQFGFASAEAAIGKWLAFDADGESHQFTIVGVVKNFHFKDLHEAIEPFAFRLYNDAGFNYMIAHTQSGSIGKSLASLESTWKKLNPGEPFEYSFLDLDFQKNYEAENKQASLINAFTVIAIIISCLGLLGLAIFSAEQRTKEIGVRKVLGASVFNLAGLLSGDFLKLVAFAILIASPVAWWAMNGWLQAFTYRIAVSWWMFVLAGMIAVFIALFTVSFQALKTAVANPVKSLRTE
jgi:putative ABC transport system permease protein